jgi:acyl-CoA reductase-like NAD-dependent aldehyde dehydrogenase
MIVFADADLDRAVEGARFGAFGNCGQTCVGVERIYVERPRYEDFVAAFSDKARSLRIGDELGPLISERQRERVEALVVDAVERGARVVTGGGRPTVRLPGWFYEPTVLADVPTEARIGREEIFGPVVTIEPFGTEAEAVRRANATSYGLGGSVWTRDRERARRVASQLETGMVWTNDYGYSWGTAQAPWGGVKESGLGRVASRHGLYELSRIRYVDADRGRVRVPWWFPYDERLDDGYRGALDVLYGKRFGALWRRRRGLLRLGGRYLGRG